MKADLESLQVAFSDGVFGAERGILGELKAHTGLDTGSRFDIYRQGYRARLVDALRDSFGHTATYLGDERFDGVARDYVEGHPPRHYSIRWYGDAFPEWLGTTHAQNPDVAELASLDWALRSAFDSAEGQPLRAADLAGLSPEAWGCVGFHLHPAFRILELHRNTLAIWQALDSETTPPATQALGSPAMLLIWRRETQPHFRTLEAEEHGALRALHEGESFAAVCSRLAENRLPEEAAALAGKWLRRWIEEELLVARDGDSLIR